MSKSGTSPCKSDQSFAKEASSKSLRRLQQWSTQRELENRKPGIKTSKEVQKAREILEGWSSCSSRGHAKPNQIESKSTKATGYNVKGSARFCNRLFSKVKRKKPVTRLWIAKSSTTVQILGKSKRKHKEFIGKPIVIASAKGVIQVGEQLPLRMTDMAFEMTPMLLDDDVPPILLKVRPADKTSMKVAPSWCCQMHTPRNEFENGMPDNNTM